MIESLPLPGIAEPPKKRGRPKTGIALTPAQKQAAYRDREAKRKQEEAADVARAFSSDSDQKVAEWIVKGGPKISKSAWLEFGKRNGWL